MERQSEENKPPSMEEVRKRRLAYFQSSSREDLLGDPPNVKPSFEDLKQGKHGTYQSNNGIGAAGYDSVLPDRNEKAAQKESILARERGRSLDRTPAVHSRSSKTAKLPPQTLSGSRDGASQPAERKTSAGKTAGKLSTTTEEDILSRDWNSHVEHLFKKEQERAKEEKAFERKDSRELLRESQDLDAVSMFKSEADCDELGLSTHRPESDGPCLAENRNNSNSAGFLEDSISEEMKHLLGETKYQEFVEKSVKDINELYHHKTTETSPHLIKSLIEDQSKKGQVTEERGGQDESITASRDESHGRQMNNRANSHSPRHRLHRPRNEPVHIQNLVTKTKRDLEQEGSDAIPASGKNYEQVTVSRNVTFSADEIYRQAFGVPAPPYQPMMSPQSSVAYNHGMPYHPAMMINMPPPQGGFQPPQGMYFPPDFSHPPPGHYMYPNQQDMFTPRTPTTPTSPHPVYYPQYQGDPNFHGVVGDPNFQRAYQGFGNVYQSQPFSPQGFPQYANYPPPVHIPHPPPQPPNMNIQHPPNTNIQHPPNMNIQHPPNMNIQHPPPGVAMYYSYPQNVPKIPHPPLERKEEDSPAEVKAHTYTGDKDLPPSMSVQAPNHPEQDASHHKMENVREDPTGTGAPDRHIEAIRIHHEQRRQMQEEKMNEAIHMQKQKKFAEASLDRYFSSLENIYRGSGSNQSSLPQTEEESEDTPEEQQSDGGQQATDGGEDDAYTSVTATSVKAGGITERLEGLGIDLAYVKEKEDHAKGEGQDEEKQKKRKKVKVCPGCESWNKEYMSWCADCGEILIGVEAVVAKKKEKRKTKAGVKENKEETNAKQDKPNELKVQTPSARRNRSISPGILSFRHGENTQVTVTKPVVEGHIDKHLDRAKQILAGPMKGSKASTSFVRSPQEINDLCEVISDPVIRGFIKNYFSRKAGPNQSHAQGQEAMAEEEQGEEMPRAEADTELSDGEVILNLASSVETTALAKNSKNSSQKESKFREHGDIDVEIFGIEESKQSRTSCRNTPVVPSLDLHDSSDDEEVIQRRRLAMATQPVSFSVDTDDWSSVHDSQQLNPDDFSTEYPADSGMLPPSQSFLSHILAMRASQSNDARQQPVSDDVDRKRTTKSIVRESIDAEPYQRHWEKSSIAWGSYHPRELNTRSSLQNVMVRDSRVRSSNSNENLSSGNHRTEGKTQPAAHTFKKVRPASADLYRKKAQSNIRPTSAQVRSTQQAGPGTRDTHTHSPSQPNVIPHRLPPEQTQTASPMVLQGPSSAITAYNMYMEMTPRIEEGEFSKWQCLPDEIWLYVFSFLQHKDLACASRVCKQFCRIAVDDSLWKYITVKKKDGICDEWLDQIANRHPVSLALIQCHGDNVTAKGLRELFRECADCLRELNFSRCSRGGLTGDSILLHASARCRNLTHVDASWCHVTDNGIIALSESAHRLESLCLNGCQMLSDEGIGTVIKKHGSSLRVLEMFGCFNMTPKSIRCVATNCTNLNTINLGQCFRLTDSCITNLSASLGRVEHLDLRGCKQIKDNCIRKIVRNCPRLKTITIANCPHISDASLIEIATYAMDVRSIDICGCRHVTDRSIRTLANNCQRLTQLDISSSGCSHHSVLLLANYCNRSLEVLKLNFLADVTEASLHKLVKHCKKLKTLHLYGCTSVRSIDKLKQICPFLHVEM